MKSLKSRRKYLNCLIVGARCVDYIYIDICVRLFLVCYYSFLWWTSTWRHWRLEARETRDVVSVCVASSSRGWTPWVMVLRCGTTVIHDEKVRTRHIGVHLRCVNFDSAETDVFSTNGGSLALFADCGLCMCMCL